MTQPKMQTLRVRRITLTHLAQKLNSTGDPALREVGTRITQLTRLQHLNELTHDEYDAIAGSAQILYTRWKRGLRAMVES